MKKEEKEKYGIVGAYKGNGWDDLDAGFYMVEVRGRKTLKEKIKTYKYKFYTEDIKNEKDIMSLFMFLREMKELKNDYNGYVKKGVVIYTHYFHSEIIFGRANPLTEEQRNILSFNDKGFIKFLNMNPDEKMFMENCLRKKKLKMIKQKSMGV